MTEFNEEELDLIAAALNYVQHCQGMFVDHLMYQGHEDLAKFAISDLDRVRQKSLQRLHDEREYVYFQDHESVTHYRTGYGIIEYFDVKTNKWEKVQESRHG